jgi:hypothetical protein
MQRPVLPLVPWPRSVELGDGRLALNGHPWRAHHQVLLLSSIAYKLAQLAAELQSGFELPPFSVRVGEPRSAPPEVREPGGYGLVIDSGGLALRGADADGLFWGLVTCERLLDGGRSLPALTIRDWPEIAIRYHHDDVSRKQVSRLADFKRIIRLLSSFKISHYTLYLEDMLHLKSHPDIGEGRGKLTPDEVNAIVREGELHHVQVFPTFTLIGHQENLLAKEKYAHLGRKVFWQMSSLDPAKPEVRAFLEKVIEDVCALFPAKLFHMGFDETQGVDAPTFLMHANWCAEQLVKRGKTPVMWVDMIYNHFGYETVKQLHPAIIPCNWQYDAKPPVAQQAELEAQGRRVWGLAGYNNWCCFMPDAAEAKRSIAAWAGQLAGRADAALGCSQWGDDGYENSRDLCWPLFAQFAEATWSGASADAASFDARFERSFYGAELPEVRRIWSELPSALSTRPGAFWRDHRRSGQALVRMAGATSGGADGDEAALDAALAAVARSRPLARREAEHLDHLEVALLRTRSVARRRAFARRRASGAPDPAGAAGVAEELERTRDRYREVWLHHNKPENLEVSSAVFDRIADSFRRLDQPEPAFDAARWLPLDLGARFDTCSGDVGGLPFGLGEVGGVPYRFAGIGATHAAMKQAGEALRLPFAATAIRDLRLIATAPRPADEKRLPALRVELMRGKERVFAEDLKLISHLCDWWAPLGEHMWAGGGYAHVDRSRVSYLFSPGAPFGLCGIHGFAVQAGTVADALVLTPLIATDLALFAATIERG